MAHEVQSFDKDVLETSYDTPVLVDFWAEWCGPCRSLGPVLEELASQNAGKWKLVKVNTDEHHELSVRYGIRGIPAVKLFVDGQVADEFVGALPKYAVEQWLDQALPSEARSLVQEARAALEAGRTEDGIRHLDAALTLEPSNYEAAVFLAQQVVFDEPERALSILEQTELPDPLLAQVGDGIALIAGLLAQRDPSGGLPEGAGKEAYVRAIEAVRSGDLEAALQDFIAVISRDRYYHDDGARKACLALFNILGPDHPITRKYRRTFDMALY